MKDKFCFDCKYFLQPMPTYDNPIPDFYCGVTVTETEPTNNACENFEELEEGI